MIDVDSIEIHMCDLQVKQIKTFEAEVAALRGLTGEQRNSIGILTSQLDDIKAKLDESTQSLDDAMTKIRKMTMQYAS